MRYFDFEHEAMRHALYACLLAGKPAVVYELIDGRWAVGAEDEPLPERVKRRIPTGRNGQPCAE